MADSGLCPSPRVDGTEVALARHHGTPGRQRYGQPATGRGTAVTEQVDQIGRHGCFGDRQADLAEHPRRPQQCRAAAGARLCVVRGQHPSQGTLGETVFAGVATLILAAALLVGGGWLSWILRRTRTGG